MIEVPDVFILNPAMNSGVFEERYGDFVHELTGPHGLTVARVKHKDYHAESGTWKVMGITADENGAVFPSSMVEVPVSGVVRDLTMPHSVDKPLYDHEGRDATFVHSRALERLLRRDDHLYGLFPDLFPETTVAHDFSETQEAVARTAGQVMVAEAVIRDKRAVWHETADDDDILERVEQWDGFAEPDNPLLVREVIDSSRGVDELGVIGAHRIRAVLVGGATLFAVAQAEGVQPGVYQQFYDPEQLPTGMRGIIDTVTERLRVEVPDADTSVIAVDMVRGSGFDGKQRDWLVGIPRKPPRVSGRDLSQNDAHIARSLLGTASKLDRAEAALLARVVDDRRRQS